MLHYFCSFLFCLFLQIKRVNSEAYKKTFEEIVRNIDKMEKECIPSVTLMKREVKFPITFSPNIVEWEHEWLSDMPSHCIFYKLFTNEALY